MNLKTYMNKKGYSIKKMAAILGVSEPMIYKVISGERNLSHEKMLALHKHNKTRFPLPKWVHPRGLSSK